MANHGKSVHNINRTINLFIFVIRYAFTWNWHLKSDQCWCSCCWMEIGYHNWRALTHLIHPSATDRWTYKRVSFKSNQKQKANKKKSSKFRCELSIQHAARSSTVTINEYQWKRTAVKFKWRKLSIYNESCSFLVSFHKCKCAFKLLQ